jgi:hypothetical protein
MPWIDSLRPKEPITRREYNRKGSVLVEWLAKGSEQDSLRGFVIYRSEEPHPDLDSVHVFEFIPYDPVASFVIRSATGEPEKGIYYFVTALSRTNVESQPASLFDLEASP